MEFLEDGQIAEWYATCREADNAASVSTIMRRYFGQAVTPRGQEAEVAAAAVEALGSWDECLLRITEWGVWPSSEDWPRYYAERGAQGERRALNVAPGHLFFAGECHLLTRFLQLTMENAWGSQLQCVNGGRVSRRLLTSHDEYLEIDAVLNRT